MGQHAAEDGQDRRGLLIQALVGGASQALEILECLRRGGRHSGGGCGRALRYVRVIVGVGEGSVRSAKNKTRRLRVDCLANAVVRRASHGAAPCVGLMHA